MEAGFDFRMVCVAAFSPELIVGMVVCGAMWVVVRTIDGAESGGLKSAVSCDRFAVIEKPVADSVAAVFPEQYRFAEIVDRLRIHPRI